MASKANPIVLVPGILGSELQVASATVWAGDSRAIRTIITPSYLLPWLPVDAGAPVSTYDNTVDFLEAKGYLKGNDLFLFGYDWRVGIEAAANALANYVENTVRLRHGGSVVFIAHSLGCLVVRWALVKNLVDSNRVQLVVAAGPPSLGSARAFKSMVEMPNISDLFDRIYRRFEQGFPNLAKRVEMALTKTLMALTSLLELMPPRGVPILSDGNQIFSAFEWPGWPKELSALRSRVEYTQAELRSGQWPSNVPRKLIASEETPTEKGYVFDISDPFDLIYKLPGDPGDGRVLIDSARDFGTDENELLVKSEHGSLLDDPDTRDWLERRF